MDAVDLLALTATERFCRIQAPDAFQQALPAQDLVASGDDAMEVVGDIENGGVAVGHLRIEGEQIVGDRAGLHRSMYPRQQFDRALHPNAPMPQQSALDAHLNWVAVRLDDKWRQQIEHDVIVIAGIKGHAVLGCGFDHATHHIQRPIAIERCDLDRHWIYVLPIDSSTLCL